MIYKIDLQLFAGQGGSGEKTEKATPKKKQDARKKGQVFQSREISSAMVLMFVFITIRIFGSSMYSEIAQYTKKVFTEYPKMDNFYMPDILVRMFIDSITVMLKVMAPIFIVAMVTGLIVCYAQVGFIFTLETLAVKFNRINPISGFKKIFSTHGAVELVKSLLKISIIGYVAYAYLNGQADNIIRLMDMDVLSIATYIIVAALNIAIRICAVLMILGIFDFAYQWWDYEKNLKMTKQEIKEEYKQTEGNPEIKSRIKQRQRQISMHRMMQDIPKADVVITNPTHFACAVKYDPKELDAPMLLAKGQDYIALRIKEIAKEKKVQIVENKALARTIFETVNVGQKIPPDLYQAVAEVLAFVYNLR